MYKKQSYMMKKVVVNSLYIAKISQGISKKGSQKPILEKGAVSIEIL